MRVACGGVSHIMTEHEGCVIFKEDGVWGHHHQIIVSKHERPHGILYVEINPGGRAVPFSAIESAVKHATKILGPSFYASRRAKDSWEGRNALRNLFSLRRCRFGRWWILQEMVWRLGRIKVIARWAANLLRKEGE